MTTLPRSHSAIVQGDDGAPILAKERPAPAPTPGTILIKTAAVALNPSDYKMGAAFPTPGAVMGMDFSGTVLDIPHDTTSDLNVGDRVCGSVHGSNPSEPGNGAFAEHVRARPELLLRVPPVLSMAEAATFGVGLMTNILALWDPSALALAATPASPAEKPLPVLVYGGSTATGSLAIQLLRLSHLKPIVTCSPHNFDLVRAMGADRQVDYMQPEAVEDVKCIAANRLKYAYDCIADPASVAFCYKALSRTGGRYVALEMVPEELRTRRAVKATTVLGYEGFGKDVALSKGYQSQADPGKMTLTIKMYRVMQKLLDEGSLKPHPVEKIEGGLPGVLRGLQMLKSGSVSGRKLVVVL